MTREEAERIVRRFDEFRKNHSSDCERELRSIQLRHPTVRFFDQYNRPTREFKTFVTNLRKFLREARKIEKLEKRQVEEFVDGIVVFGSCHLDVWGDVAKNEVGVIDQPGSVTYSVGGTAYNIAYNLRSRGLAIAIFSCIRAGSAVSEYILRRVREAGIVDNYIHKLTDFPESAFVAHRVNGELVSAVSSMAIETHGRFSKAAVEEVIKRSRVVVFECNLSLVQIELISRLAMIAQRPVLCAAVSEPKASRILASYRTKDGPALLAACVNESEFAAVAKKHDMSGSGRDVLEKLNCKAIFVTRGTAGYDLLSIDSPTPKHFPAPNVTNVVNTSGAGDALLSGVVHSVYCCNGTLNIEDCQERIEDYVRAVLAEIGSTVGASVDPSEIVHRTIEVSADKKKKPRTFGQKIMYYAGQAWSIPALIVALLAVPAFFFSDEFAKLFEFVLRHVKDGYHWVMHFLWHK